MKTRLPKALIIALLASMSGVATAATMYPNEVLVVDEGKIITWTNYDNMQEGDAASPLVKDGAGTLRFENVQGSKANYYRAPLVAREGKVEVVDSNMYAHGTYVPGPAATTWIMVGGKNAEMSFTNSSFRISTGETHMNVGTADGNGTLSLDKTDMKVTGSIFAGYHSYSNNEDSWGLGYYYNMNGTAATDDIPAAEQNNKGLTHRYTEGEYKDGYNGHKRKFGEGIINVTNGSTLEVATAFTLGYATLNVSGDTTLVKTQTGYGGIVQDDAPYEYVDTYAVTLGRWSGAESKISITEGARMEMNGQLRTVRSSGLVNTKSTVEVSGAGSELLVKATANLGLYDTSGRNTTIVNALMGGTLNFEKAVLGYDVDMTIGKDSFYNGASLHMKSDSVTVTNAGLMTVKSVLVEGGALINSGMIVGDIVVDGGEVTLVNGAKTANLSATSGSLAVLGDVVFNGDIMLSDTGFLFTDGATIDLQGHDFSFDGGAVTIVVNAATPAVAMYSLEDEEMLASYGITFKNAGTVTGFEDDIVVTLATMDAEGQIIETGATYTLKASDVKVQSIPEPATATLSLLALAGLCARRRRK